MASATDGPSGLDATSSLEIALDQAIAQRYASASEWSGKKRRNTPVQNFAVGARPEQAHTPTEDLGRRASTALVVPSRETALMRPPPRLRWKGIEVSDEFQEYAARIARGEQLEPYRGAVLSRRCDEFPWGGPRARPTLLPPPCASQRPSFAPVAVPVFAAPVSEPTVYPERGRALKTALWLAGAVSSIIAALGVGAGATNTAGNEFDDLVPTPKPLAQTPAPAAAVASGSPIVSSLAEASELEASIGQRQLDSLAASAGANPKPPMAHLLAPAVPARATPAPIVAAPQPPLVPSPNATAAGITATIAPSTTSRLTIPPSGPVPSASGLPRGIVTTARPVEPSGGSSLHDSSLFSDRAPF